jgi:putative methyltransferase (TIGR04325 family)
MNIKKSLRSLVPPLFLELYHRLRPQRTWEGLYTSCSEVDVKGEGLDGDIWADIVERETREVAEALTQGGIVPGLLEGDNALLPLLVAAISARSDLKDSIKILDFGGGAGVDYLYVKSAVPQLDNLEYHIVESDEVCRRGRIIFQAEPRVFFHTALPEHISYFDIIHIDSVLQYIEDYSLLLKSLCKYKPDYFIFVRLSAGDIPTYATKQINVSGVCCAYQFINVGDFTTTMNQLGYTLGFKSSGEVEYQQDNFPRAYRMGHTCNLLFMKNKTN